jgi:hypothetical protein
MTFISLERKEAIKMKFTEEQIEAILDCIENASVELYKDEWEEIKESLRKGNE